MRADGSCTVEQRVIKVVMNMRVWTLRKDLDNRVVCIAARHGPASTTLSSQKFARQSGKATKKAVIFSQILECSKSSEVHSTERNLPLEVKLSCNLVKESLNFSNLVFSNLYFLCLWRFPHFFSDNRRTTWKKYFERNNLGTKRLHRT